MTVTREPQPVTTSIGHTFICYARHDSAFVTDVATGLRSRGVPIWIDQWNIEPGSDWTASIDAALNGCRSVLIVLSPEAVASNEVRTELRAALNGRKRIVPLLHRPCSIPRQLLLTHHLDWSASAEISEASLDALADVLRTSQTSTEPEFPGAMDWGGRRTLLEDVRAEARDRLQSTGTGSPIDILLERQPHQVARPWDNELVASAPRLPPPPSADILDIFDDAAADGSLLILGAPGSGKTTVLVQLMQHLAARADPEAGRPIPVLLSLSSWNDKKPLDQWLVDELNVKYGVRRDVGRRWRDAGLIMLLFDGLDEVPPEYQHACVEAINAFEVAYKPRHLVVCCRLAEYEHLPVRLRLRDAVCLRPLDPAQIRTYLDRAGASTLWSAVEDDPDLLEMARSPLLLSFISCMASEPDVAPVPRAASAMERRRRLFDGYLSAQLSAAVSRPAYPPQQTMRRLGQLATILRRKGLSEFLIERMQPDWLASRAERWSYRAVVLMVSAATVFLVVQSLLALFGLFPQGRISLALQRPEFSQLTTGGSPLERTVMVLFPIIVGCVVAWRKTIVPIETLTWSWSRAAMNTGLWARTAASAGLAYGTTLGALASIAWYLATLRPGGPGASPWQSAGELMGGVGGVFAAIVIARVRPAAWIRAPRSLSRRRAVDALIAAVVYALVAGSTLTWAAGPLAAIAIFVVVGLSAASNDRDRLVLLKWPVATAISGAVVGAFSWPILSSSVPLLIWMGAWVGGALNVGIFAGLARTLFNLFCDWRRGTHTYMPIEAKRGWTRLALAALLVGLLLGLAAVAMTRVAGDQAIRNVALFGWFVQSGLALALVFVLLGTFSAAAGGAAMAGLLGGLAGALSGATGADVERRILPNQGIRQSALNVAIFSALGVLIIGVPYGLLNVAVATAMVQTLPTAGDWLRYGVGAGVGLGVLAGLLPGAACIQHFVLRVVLWTAGAAPLRLVRFLHFATERRVLQRVGGRYRFIHVSLRDHLADSAPERQAS